MNPNRQETAHALATYHANYDEDVLEVIQLTSAGEEDADEPIKLLEVNASTASAGIMPVYFGPSTVIPFASIIVEVTPDEFRQIESKELTLPDGWGLGDVLFTRNGVKVPQ